MRRRSALWVLELLCCLLCGAVSSADAGLADEVLALTGGARVKVIWARDERGDNSTWGVESDGFTLVRYDTADDTIRVIRSTLDNYSRPLITPDGQRVVYTDAMEGKVRIIPFTGGSPQLVVSGSAGAVWRDPDTGVQWLYYAEPSGSPPPVKRLDLDDPAHRELVWNQTETSAGYLSVSGDGARVVSCWPWPKCGVVVPDYDGGGGGDLFYSDNGYYATGCLPTITPDDSYRVGVFDSAHRNWRVWDRPGGAMRLVELHTAVPTMAADDAVYHPHHSNRARFISLIAPMRGSRDVYLGKTDDGFTRVTDWVQVTDTGASEYAPIAWIASASPPPPTPAMALDPTALSFTAAEGGDSPSSQTVEVTNSGTGILDPVSVSDSAAWLTVNRSDSDDVQVLSNAVDISGLDAGDYSTTVTVDCSNATNAPRSYTVNLTVREQRRVATVVVTASMDQTVPGHSVNLTASVWDQHDDEIAEQVSWSVSGGGQLAPVDGSEPASEHRAVFTSDASVGRFTVTAEAGGVSGAAVVEVVEVPLPLAMNCGDNAYDVAGWWRDDPFVDGGHDWVNSHDVSTQGVANAAPAAVYKSVRHGTAHHYDIPVPDGHYLLRLHFADAFSGRRMDYYAEGDRLLADFDISSEAGGENIALVKEFSVRVQDGDGLQIEAASEDDALHAAIELLPSTGIDAGLGVDAGSERDTGHAGDAGAADSAGTAADAGTTDDAGAANDAAEEVDAGSELDTGHQQDAGSPGDIAAPADGAERDAAAALDAAAAALDAAAADIGLSAPEPDGDLDATQLGQGCSCDDHGARPPLAVLVVLALALLYARRQLPVAPR